MGSEGNPVASENLIVTGVEARAACGARVKEAASRNGVNVPFSMMPLVWAGRKPGCRPKIVSNCFNTSLASWTILSSDGSGNVFLLKRLLADAYDPIRLVERFGWC
jgi:hypothetical protein